MCEVETDLSVFHSYIVDDNIMKLVNMILLLDL